MSHQVPDEMSVESLFHRLDTLGVVEYVVCAGARNAALLEVISARALQDSRFQIYHFFDERSAAFFALGRIMSAETPVAVFTTSGTAVAELLPAMVEAHYQGLPLIAVTADRPPHYAGSGAPQAIEQINIFGIYANSREGGPLHFNIPLEEKNLTPETLSKCLQIAEQLPVKDADSTAAQPLDVTPLHPDNAIVLAAGIHPHAASAVADVLTHLQLPVMAEATANLHDFAQLKPLMLKGGEKALRMRSVRHVMRIGAVPSWRWWRDLEDKPEVSVLNISPSGFAGLARKENVNSLPWHTLRSLSTGSLNRSVSQSGLTSDAIVESLQGILTSYPNSEVAWLGHVSQLMGKGATVMLGNSLPIREWNLAAPTIAEGSKFYANRGANGIDGLVSTWLGLGANEDESWLILGDLSALYDANALWALPQLKQGEGTKRRLVVINNYGGQIFSRVGWLSSLSSDVQKILKNPHQLNFAAWAEMWGADYQRFTNHTDLVDDDSAMAIWEIVPDAEQSQAFWKAWS